MRCCLFFFLSSLALQAAPRDFEVELLDTTYRLNTDHTADVFLHQRYRALTAQGRAAISKIQVPFVAAYQDVEIKSIRTLKKDGATVSGDPSTAFDAAPSTDPRLPIFTDLKVKTILPPNVETGDAVEYEAILHIRSWPKPQEFWFTHNLSRQAPVLKETVTLDLPAGIPVSLHEGADLAGTVETRDGRRIERWTTSNSEPDGPRVEPREPVFAVSSLGTWNDFGAWIRDLNQNPSQPTPEIAALATRLTAGKTSDADKIAVLYGYVATKVRYIAVDFGLGRIQPHMAATVLQNAYGDCKDQAALLSALLTAAGFKTYAVLATPGIGVRLNDVPTPDQFNHEFTAVELNSKLLFLDTSMGPVPPGVLQPGLRGRQALLIRDTSAAVVDIPISAPVSQRTTSVLKGKIAASGAFEGTARFEFQGLNELIPRSIFLDASPTEKEAVLRTMAGPEFAKASVTKITTSDPADLARPFWVEYELATSSFFPSSQSAMSVTFQAPNPALTWLDATAPRKPFPVEAVSGSQTVDVAIDPSFETGGALPQHLKTAYSTFDSELTYDNGRLLLKRSIDLKASAVAAADWTALTDFLKTATTTSAGSFILRRNASAPTSYIPRTGNKALNDGSAALDRNDYEGAKRALLEATQLLPQNSDAWNQLGRAYSGLKDYSNAEHTLKRAIELNPKHGGAYNNLAIVYANLGRQNDAIVYYRKQIEVNPRRPNAHHNLSLALARQQKWEQALAEAAIVVEISPEVPVEWIQLAKMQAKTGHTDDAEKSFNRAAAVSKDPFTPNNVAYAMAEAGINLDKAWALVTPLLETEAAKACDPKTASNDDPCALQLRRLAPSLDTAGWVLYHQNKLTEAEPYLKSACTISRSVTETLHLVQLYAKMGRLDEAVKYFATLQARPNFAQLDTTDARQQLAKLAGSDAKLDSLLAEHPAPSGPTASVLVLVDEKGRVLQVKPDDAKTPETVVTQAQSLTLDPISWPGHSLRSVRTLTFREENGHWILQL